MTLTFQSSVVFVQDIAASRRFYEELLGQEVEMDHGLSLTFKNGFALWQVDHAFQTIYGRMPDDAERLGGHTYELHLETADAKTASVRLSEAGVEFVHPLREMPWGKRIFRVRDPDGTLSPWENRWPRSSHVCSVRACQQKQWPSVRRCRSRSWSKSPKEKLNGSSRR